MCIGTGARSAAGRTSARCLSTSVTSPGWRSAARCREPLLNIGWTPIERRAHGIAARGGVYLGGMKRSLGSDYKGMFVVLAVLATATAACDKSNDKAASSEATAASATAASATAAAATAAATAAEKAPSGGPGAVKVGDTCKELGVMDAKLACDGNKVLFCSSFTSYEWKVQNECPAGQSCIVDPATNSAGCK